MKPPEQINWTEVVASLYLFRHRFGLNSSYYDKVLRALARWDSIADVAKEKAVYDSFMYLMQADSKSGLLSRLRDLTGKSMLVGFAELARKVTNIVRLKEPRNGIFEDDGGAAAGTSAGNIANGDGAVGSGNSIIDQLGSDMGNNVLEPYQFLSMKKKKGANGEKFEKIKKRERKFKLIKFKAPSSAKRKY